VDYGFAACPGGSHVAGSEHRVTVGVRVAGSSSAVTSLPALTERDTDQNSDHSSAAAPAATERPVGAMRDCSTDADCDGELGETCVRLYDGCRRGQCMCDPATSTGSPPPARTRASTDGDRPPPRPWDVAAGSDRRTPLGYCHHRRRSAAAARTYDKLDAKCDLCRRNRSAMSSCRRIYTWSAFRVACYGRPM